MVDNKCALAMYDVRGKQDYIFRGNKIKEIVGGSLIIRDIYKDYLLSDSEYKIYMYEKNVDVVKDIPQFSWETFRNHIEDGFDGEVVYDGGGNFLVLFKNASIYEQITHKFTFNVLKATASLRVVGTYIEVDESDSFLISQKKLYAKHRLTENTVQNVPLYGSLPIVMTSMTSSFPIVYRGNDYTKEEIELTAEQLAKYRKYRECIEDNESSDYEEINEEVLDNIAPEKGVDSHIAIIYIDGNSMGAKVQECTKISNSFEESVNALRIFSWKIQKEYIDSKKKVIDDKLSELHKDDTVKRRLILGAGDEINFIVAGRDAYEVAKAYLEALGDNSEYATSGSIYSSCAGIAIFKSHVPYADAYRIAEECCESGKDKMKLLDEKGNVRYSDTSFLDFHLCQGAIDVSLEQIRKSEETMSSSRPWLITDPKGEYKLGDEIFPIKDIQEIVKFLQKLGHGNVKGLLAASRQGVMALDMELRRIKAHQKEDKRKAMENEWKVFEDVDERKCKMIYDIVLMYDLWFRNEEV